MQKLWHAADTDTGKITAMLGLANAYLTKPGEYRNDLDSAMLLTLQARKASEPLKFVKGIGESLFLEGQIYREAGKNEKALYCNKQALVFFIRHHMLKQQGDAQLGFNLLLDLQGHLDEKITYLETAVNLYHRAKALTDEAITLQNLGEYYIFKGDRMKSIKLLETSLAIFERIHYKDKQGVYTLLNGNYSFLGNQYRALRYGLLALKTANAVKDTSIQLCAIYNRIGLAYYYMENLGKASEYYEKALKVAKHYHDDDAAFQIQYCMIVVSEKRRQFDKALNQLKQLSLSVSPGNNGKYLRLCETYAQVYMDLGQYNKAKVYVDDLVNLLKGIPVGKLLGSNFEWTIIRYYLLAKQYPELYQQLAIVDSATKASPNLFWEKTTQSYWSRADSATGKMSSALQHYQRYKLLSDSINNQNQAKQLAELQLKYDMDTKDQQVKLLMQNGQLQTTRLKNEVTLRYVFIGGIAVLLFFAGLMYNRSRIRVKHNLELTAKQKEINNKNTQLHALLSEKDWLLKEIHHRVKNNLQIVISLLNTQSSYLENEDAVSAIRHSQQRMYAISLIHQKLYQSENLSTIDMPNYIMELVEYLAESYKNEKKIIFRQLITPLNLDVAQAVPLGLILNEAISNSVKYAFIGRSTGTITISLQAEADNYYQLCINDDGRGLSPGFDPVQSGSLGMSLMYGLSEQLNAELKLISENGVSVCVTFKADPNNYSNDRII